MLDGNSVVSQQSPLSNSMPGSETSASPQTASNDDALRLVGSGEEQK
jgi:hypothetical protein